jgi:uncharacterized protein
VSESGGNLAVSSTDLAMPTVTLRTVSSIADVPRQAWDGLDHGRSPFLKTGFLRALELSGSVSCAGAGLGKASSGWIPTYLLAESNGRLLGAVAAFVKNHSYGEYIFDWAWANAAERAGIAYYPKIVVAAPATPATGKRILLATELGEPQRQAVALALASAVREIALQIRASSVHWLFCTQQEQALLVDAGFWPRASFQFHWHNAEYANYDAFTAQLKSRKRKQLRKEREKAHAAAKEFRWVRGDELTVADLDTLDRFYRNTTDNHGGRDYLRPGFFQACAKELPHEMWMMQVHGESQMIAGALFFEGPQTLYGRYWGAEQAPEFLHFETAYYQGIERAISRGLTLFEAGAQGEHKLLRGFVPSATYSAHWMAHPGLDEAISAHCKREATSVTEQMAQLAEFGPYRDASDDKD